MTAEAILLWARRVRDLDTAKRLELALRLLEHVEVSAAFEKTHACRCDCATAWLQLARNEVMQ